jgi:hypothetical protein
MLTLIELLIFLTYWVSFKILNKTASHKQRLNRVQFVFRKTKLKKLLCVLVQFKTYQFIFTVQQLKVVPVQNQKKNSFLQRIFSLLILQI